MQINKKILELYRNLPRGSKKMICEISGLSEKTVYNCVNEKSTTFATLSKLNKAILKVHTSIKKISG